MVVRKKQLGRLSKKGLAQTPSRKEESTALVVAKPKVELTLEESLTQLEKTAGGRVRLIEGLAATGHPDAKEFIKALGNAGNADLTLYEVCNAVKRSPHELLKIWSEGALVRGAVEACLALGNGLPKVVEKSIEVATTYEDGFKDREMLLKMGGMLKEGGGFVVNVTQNANSPQTLKVGDGAFEEIVKKSSAISRKNPFTVEPEVVDAEVVAEEEVTEENGTTP